MNMEEENKKNYKNTAMLYFIIKEIKKLKIQDISSIQSFDPRALRYLHEKDKELVLVYLVEKVERIRMTSTTYTNTFSYDERGKLASIQKTSNRKDGIIEELKFRYDELGNLIEKHVYKDGVFTTDIQIIYNSKSKLLATVITKQVSTGFMMILRFQDYEFYD